ncbi:MAG: hypothetical protein NT027_07120 [Proteobacteria bacterium]|nr:hypothetical protein [Pseudomonadota bacterium]
MVSWGLRQFGVLNTNAIQLTFKGASMKLTAIAFSLVSFVNSTSILASELNLIPLNEISQAKFKEHLIANDPLPSDSLQSGRYETREGYFSNFVVSKWADEYVVKTLVRYAEYYLDAEYSIEHVSGNEFRGRGQIEATYANNKSCFYTTTIEIKAYENRLFIKTYMQQGIADQIVNGYCPVLPYGSFVHRSPYDRVGN